MSDESILVQRRWREHFSFYDTFPIFIPGFTSTIALVSTMSMMGRKYQCYRARNVYRVVRRCQVAPVHPLATGIIACPFYEIGFAELGRAKLLPTAMLVIECSIDRRSWIQIRRVHHTLKEEKRRYQKGDLVRHRDTMISTDELVACCRHQELQD